MINFIAHDFWSAVWLAALVVAGLVVHWRRDAKGYRILWCFAASWLMTRTIVTFANDSNLAWIASEAVVIAMLVLYGKSFPAVAVAVLFAAMLVMDHLVALGIITDSGAKAGSDLLGYIGLLIMAGASRVGGGKMERRKPSTFGLGGLGGRWSSASVVAGRGAISARPGMSGASLDGGQSVVP